MKKIIRSLVFVITTVLIFSNIAPVLANAKEMERNNFLSTTKQIIDNSDFNSELGMVDKEAIEYLDSLQINVIEDNENFRIVESIENGKPMVATFDKNSNILTTQIKGDDSSKLVIDLNELAALEESMKEPTSGDISAFASSMKQDTFTNYEYTIEFTSPESWQLRRPNPDNPINWLYKDVKKTTSNATNLGNFKNAVNDLNDYEWKYIGAASGAGILAIAALIVGAINGGAGIAVGLAAAGVTGAAYNYAISMNRAANDAHYYYFQV
ncbi:geobacillin-26 family protein [Lysinibacillus sp. NPDC097231]|uniref:geobacillin-26 family protein n=1 Tax=Lysinibacillus sp. NPDC097231 TaxID=3364142 RepID=UPI0038055E79